MNEQAAVFILLGQSNAVGHAVPMEEADKITEPMANVFGLSRERNQSYDNTELYWEGYRSAGMNLAEEQDDTWSMANCLAKQWQAEIDEGNPRNLPDLYIVQIAIGAQGVTEPFMWYPLREKKLVPGKLGTVDISLFPFTTHILSMVDDSIREQGKEPVHMGIFWKGGEEEIDYPVMNYYHKLNGIYHTLFDGFTEALGHEVPIYLYRIVDSCCGRARKEGNWIVRMNFVDRTFDELEQEYPNVTVKDVRKSPLYNPTLPNEGLYEEDLVHYSPAANRWFAKDALETFLKAKSVL